MGPGRPEESKGSKDARGTENCLTIVQVKSTNKQIKSVYSCDTIKVFPY